MAFNDPKNQQNQGFKPQNPQQQRRGSGFTNINRVLQANTNNRLGQAVSQGVLGQSEQARQNIRGSASQFRDQANQGRLDTEANRAARSNVLNKVEQTQDTPPVVGEQEVGQFEKFRSGAYSGPQQLQNEGELQAQTENAQALGRMTQTSGGRQGLLQRYAGGGQYNVGQQRIDNLLLSAQPGALNAVRRYTSGLDEDLSRAKNEAANLSSMYTQQAKGFADETSRMLAEKNKAQEDLARSDFEAKAKASTDVDAKLNALREDLAKGEISKEDAEALGITDLMGRSAMGGNFADYLKREGSSVPTSEADTIEKMNAARINALQKLMGRQDKYDLEKAGQYKAAKAGFDVDKFKQDIGNKDIEARKELERATALGRLGAGDAGLKGSLQHLNTLGANIDYNRLVNTMGATDSSGKQDYILNEQTRNMINNVRNTAANTFYSNPELQKQFGDVNKYVNQQVVNAVSDQGIYNPAFQQAQQKAMNEYNQRSDFSSYPNLPRYTENANDTLARLFRSMAGMNTDQTESYNRQAQEIQAKYGDMLKNILKEKKKS